MAQVITRSRLDVEAYGTMGEITIDF